MAVRETYISKTLSALGDGVAKVDEKIKALLADKQILARILKYSVEEFKEYDILEIINRIEEVEILEVPVDAGLSYKSKNEFGKISGSNTEDNVPGEGVIYYDIRFNVTKGKRMFISLIFCSVALSISFCPEKPYPSGGFPFLPTMDLN